MENTKKDTALKMPTPAELGGTTAVTELKRLLIDSLKKIYWAEQELLTVLPKMRDASTTQALRLVIEEHIIQTANHVSRLEKAFELCGEVPEAKECEAMQGLVSEGDKVVEQTVPGSMTRDAGIIFAAQKVEHYEIATYGGLVEFARTLGLKQVSGVLQATLDEEKQADQGLTLIAQTGINWQAEHELAGNHADAM